jgi:hypothetical protein
MPLWWAVFTQGTGKALLLRSKSVELGGYLNRQLNTKLSVSGSL